MENYKNNGSLSFNIVELHGSGTALYETPRIIGLFEQTFSRNNVPIESSLDLVMEISRES